METLSELIKETENLCFIGEIEQDDVLKAEQSLGLSFSAEYKEYVMAFGAAAFNGHELTGICGSDRLSVITTTVHARSIYPDFPKNAYVIEELLIDNIIVIQYSNGQVCYYGPSDEARIIAGSLRGYLFS